MSDPIVDAFKAYHTKMFKEHGATPRGLDWSASEADLRLRYEKMLAVIDKSALGNRVPSVLDVGCGYGGLLSYANECGVVLDYTGIDLVGDMVRYASELHTKAAFIHADFREHQFGHGFDYVVCNGILTQKLHAGRRQMLKFTKESIRRLYELSDRGTAFNLMSSNVNFMVENLFYTSPVEMFDFCLGEVTPHVRIDSAYRLFYEYTIYLYRDNDTNEYAP